MTLKHKSLIDQKTIQQSSPFQLLSGRLYHKGVDGILRLCIEPSNIPMYLTEAHQNIGSAHHGNTRTHQNLLRLGVYWPRMKFTTYQHIQNCKKCMIKSRVESVTLFRIAIAPQWSKYIFDCLQQIPFPANMTKTRLKSKQKEAQ